MKIIMRPDGQIMAIAHATRDAQMISALGVVAEVRRGGRVVPASFLKRALFCALRRLFGDGGRVAAWTRRWRGPWYVDMTPSRGPILGPFPNRAQAIRAEENIILEMMRET